MQLTIDPAPLGRGQIWNHCNDRYCALGLVCKEAGIEDEEMNYRTSIVFRKKPDEIGGNGRVIKTFPTKDLPDQLAAFFTEDKTWAPISKMNRGARRFKANTLGQQIIDLGDNRPDDWISLITDALGLGGVELTLESKAD